MRLTSFCVSAVRALKTVAVVLLAPASLAAALAITSPTNFTVATGTQQIALTATGATGTVTWNLVSGTLPAGLAIRTDVPSFFNPTTQTAGLIGVATATGSYNFTLSATDSAVPGSPVNQAFTVKVSAFNISSPANIPDIFLNVNYPAGSPVVQFATINPAPGGTITYSVGQGSALPAGLTLGAGGALTGTPTAAGNYNFNITATDGTDTVTAFFNLNVYAVQITTPGILTPNATQNGGYSLQLSATGSGSITWANSGGFPNGL